MANNGIHEIPTKDTEGTSTHTAGDIYIFIQFTLNYILLYNNQSQNIHHLKLIKTYLLSGIKFTYVRNMLQ